MSFCNWIQGARPKTLSAGVGPILVGTGFVIHAGVTPHLMTFALTMVCVLLLQIGANLANDYYDFVHHIDGSDRLGPERLCASGLLPPAKVKRGFYICLSLALLLGIFLVWYRSAPPLLLGLGILCVFLARAYTGGAYPLSHYALGEITALIVFGPLATWGSALLQFGPTPMPSLPVLYWGLGPGLIAASLMALNNLRDRQSDASAGKTTLATLLGEKSARFVVVIPILLASLLPVSGGFPVALTGLTALPFTPTWRRVCTEAVDVRPNRSLAATGLFLALYCLALSITLSL